MEFFHSFPIPPLDHDLAKYVFLLDVGTNSTAKMKKLAESSKKMAKFVKKYQDISSRYIQLNTEYDLDKIENKWQYSNSYFFLFAKKSKLQKKQSHELSSFYASKANDAQKIVNFATELMKVKMPAVIDFEQFDSDVNDFVLTNQTYAHRFVRINALDKHIEKLKEKYIDHQLNSLDDMKKELSSNKSGSIFTLSMATYTKFDDMFCNFILSRNEFAEFEAVSIRFLEETLTKETVRCVNEIMVKYRKLFEISDDDEFNIVNSAVTRVLFDIFYTKKPKKINLEETIRFSEKCKKYSSRTPRQMQISPSVILDEYMDKPFSEIFSLTNETKKMHDLLFESMLYSSPEDISYCLFLCSQEISNYCKKLMSNGEASNCSFDDFFSLFCCFLSSSFFVEADQISRFLSHFENYPISQALKFSLISIISATKEISNAK